MGIAPLPDDPLGSADTGEAWASPLAQKPLRETADSEAFEEEPEGDDGPYGSLVMLRPRTFKKKPVLTVDPEELEKAYQAFDVCGAQIMDGEAAPIARHGTQFLGLAPIEEGEEALESDDDVVADDDLDRLLQDALNAEEEDCEELPRLGAPQAETGTADVDQPPTQTPQGGFPETTDNALFGRPTPQSVVEQYPEIFAPQIPDESLHPSPATSEEAALGPNSESARPSVSLSEFRLDPAKEETDDPSPYGEGWSSVPPDEDPTDSYRDYAEETVAKPETDRDYGTTHYYDDEEDVFDPFADAQPRKLANVQATGTRSQLRARLLRDEDLAETQPERPRFPFFGWLRSLFG